MEDETTEPAFMLTATSEVAQPSGANTAVALAPTATPDGNVPAGPEMPPQGATVGRFVVGPILGVGGMGVVVSARDPALDREVALKLVHSPGDPTKQDAGQSRLLREARAMAKLRHPNVLTVYEAGVHGDRVFLAMERIYGGTLRDLVVRVGPDDWESVIGAFAAAGEGLAAAHREGLVHRDFKPENVLVEGERVLVADFGLVGSLDVPAAVTLQDASGEDLELADVRTREGAIMGTPVYMSPEQLYGEEVDGRSDQFSLCVALYEALYGKLPFEGRPGREVLDAIQHGRVRPVPRDLGVPSWVHDAIVRGLAHDREDRFPSMAELIDALTADPERERVGSRRRRLGIAAVAVVVVGWAGLSILIPYELGYTEMAFIDLSCLGIIALVAARERTDLLASGFNRRVVLTGLSAVVGVLVALLGAWLAGLAASVAALLHPLTLFCCASAASALLDRRLIVVALGYAAAFLLVAVRSDLFFTTSLVAHGLMGITLYLVLDDRRPAAGRGLSPGPAGRRAPRGPGSRT